MHVSIADACSGVTSCWPNSQRSVILVDRTPIKKQTVACSRPGMKQVKRW